MSFSYFRVQADVCPAQLTREMNASINITPICEYVRVDDNDQVTIAFDIALSVSEETEMDVILFAHVCVNSDDITNITSDYTINTASSGVLLVDTTNNPVQVTLDNAVNLAKKLYYIKWVDGIDENKVNIVPSESTTFVDHENGQIMGEIEDTLLIYCDGINFHIL